MTTKTEHPVAEVERHLRQAHDAADLAAGAVAGVAHGAVLDLRADIYALIRRAERIRMFEDVDRP